MKDAYSAAIGTYFYDGDGKRVKKTSATSDDVIFIYDAAGKLIEERNASTGALQTSYVYAGSRLLSTETSSGISYLTNDHLGSPRINTDGSGTVTARHDYHPFGEEIIRSGYGSDIVRKQFTSYERDGETGMDFAQARYFNPGFGRFSSPDDFLNDSVPLEPQSWNKYAYVRNNPTNRIDPTGEKVKYRITIDTNKKTVTVTAIGTIGVWSKNYGKSDLAKAAKRIEEGIESKWKGEWTDGGWKFDFNAQVSVQVFDKAGSTDDVLNTNPSIMNVVQLEDLKAVNELSEVYDQLGGNKGSKKWSLTNKKNPDGTRPDVAMWDFGNAAQTHTDSEPAHEFSHLLGVFNQGTTGTDLMAPGSGQAAKMSKNDFEKVVGNDARYFRDAHQNYVNRNPNTKIKRFQYFIWRGHCCK
ncbi:MAG: RHS repeat domain-containing protein [Pyrinomonadaceae bacterium]